jgi:DNA-binding transcriptional ArsR family regulator
MLQTSSIPDDVLDALGNPERRLLVRRLAAGPLSVTELAAGFDISRPAISRHLATLERAGLVTHRGVGTRNVYSLDLRGFEATRRWLDGFWDEAEGRLRLLAENLEAPRE